MIGREEVSLYFHIPFCAKKCPYCHFFVLPDQTLLKGQFLKSLQLEWKLYLPKLEGKEIVSIYLGGGTPSRLSPLQIASILNMVFTSSAMLAKECEITLEVNPEDVTPEFSQSLTQMGINRVSLGVQSLNNAELELLDRGHSSDKATQAIQLIAAAGIDNISIDLMFDLPHQTLKTWENTLSQIKDLPITHLSLYNLTLEPHTVFFKHKKTLSPTLPSPEDSTQMLEMALDYLTDAGLKRYEISAFAKKGLHSRHNSGYWTGRPFLGFGPSAFSYWEKKRFQNVPHLNRYSEALKEGRLPIHFEEKLEAPNARLELLAVQLRLVDGVDLTDFERRHDKLSATTYETLAQLEAKGWIARQENRICLTSQGQLFYDSVASEII